MCVYVAMHECVCILMCMCMSVTGGGLGMREHYMPTVLITELAKKS